MNKPRILFFDIETKYVKALIWRTGEQVVRTDQIADDEKFAIICIAWKWLGESTVRCPTWDARHEGHKMLDEFAAAVESADLAIGQNIDAFDIKQINLQRLLYNQPRIKWPQTEDIKKLVKKHLYVASSSLKYLSKLFGGKGKDRMEFQDWKDIVEQDSQVAMSKMVRYCKRDVLESEFVWKKIAPHVTPSIKALKAWKRAQSTGSNCPRCHSKNSVSNGRRGHSERRICSACGVGFSLKLPAKSQ